MDKEEIRDLLGNTMFARAQRYQSHVVSMDCETNGKGVRHLTALVDALTGDHAAMCAYTTKDPALRYRVLVKT